HVPYMAVFNAEKDHIGFRTVKKHRIFHIFSMSYFGTTPMNTSNEFSPMNPTLQHPMLQQMCKFQPEKSP
ncbi:MAG: hypothetical protein V2I56_15550, partial [Desulfobacteraceae bacterium]|nr:hypothetical protein [Desulfobacteraceae bacterium]